jgi:replicative DNA helicase
VNEDREPRASDLRESGSLEQDADAIWLLHKPKDPKRNGLVEERKFIQEKRRGGSVCDFSIGFIGKTTKFVFSPVEEQGGGNDGGMLWR